MRLQSRGQHQRGLSGVRAAIEMNRIIVLLFLAATGLSWLPMLGSSLESNPTTIQYLKWEKAGVAIHRVGRSLVLTHLGKIISEKVNAAGRRVQTIRFLDKPGHNFDPFLRDSLVQFELEEIRSDLRSGQLLLRRSDVGVTVLAIPCWFLPILFSAYPIFAGFRALSRHHNLEHGLCMKCGYNLVGNTSGVCPECGRAF